MLLSEGKYNKDGNDLHLNNGILRLYGETKLEPYVDDLMNRFLQKASYLCNLFLIPGAGDLSKVDIYLFSDEEKGSNFIKSQEKTFTLEPYKNAAYNKDTIVILCEYDKLHDKPFHYANVFAHIFFHLLFHSMKKNAHGTLWFEEGLAQLLSGERNRLKDEELYKNSLLKKVFDDQWKIPMIENLFEHGYENGKFDSREYNGYTIAYMLVRFLHDQELLGQFFNRIRWGEFDIESINKDIINRVYNYYGSLFKLPGYKMNIALIKNPQELFNYMERTLTYGWIDIYGEKHEHSSEDIREKYHINSLEQVLESGLATCIEQTMLEHFVLDSLGIKNKIFVNRELIKDENNKKKIRLHCFCAYEEGWHWGYFEHALTNRKGINYFDSLSNLCEYYLSIMDSNRFLIEIPEIPVGYTIKEFNEYVSTFKTLGHGLK